MLTIKVICKKNIKIKTRPTGYYYDTPKPPPYLAENVTFAAWHRVLI